jgi:hypothetical protein
MTTKQLGLVYRIIKASEHPELVQVLRTAMSRTRRDAVDDVHSQSKPLLIHLIPFVALKRAGKAIPKSWSNEIKNCFTNIDVANGRLKKIWLSPAEVEEEINEDLKTPVISRAVLRKMESHSLEAQAVVKSHLEKLFLKGRTTLRDLGVSIRQEKTELGSELIPLIDGQKL